MIYALLTQNFVMRIYVLFPQIFKTEKQNPQTFLLFGCMDKASFPRCMVGAEPREPNVYPLGFTIQIFKALEKVFFSEISQTEASKSWGASIV